MVGLADIPFVGKAVDKISDATVEAVYRGLRYMFCYKHLVDILNSEIEKVDTEEEKILSKVDVARADGKKIYDHILKWQIDLEEFRKSSDEFLKRYETRPSWGCIKRLPIPSPVHRFRLGREARKKTDRVIKLTASGSRHLADEIAYLPAGEYVPTPDTMFQNFQSRKDAYGELWKALTEGNSVIHGIYGMPGVGKTRMMEQLWEEAMKENIFKKVTRADVGCDTLDVIKLQNQIAGHLECHLESQDNTKSRANQIRNSLLNGDKILVILDDVWGEIPLDAIGIPYNDSSNSKGCKILFTSREETVCLLNKCKHPVNITTLKFDEALDLFRNIVGTSVIDSLQDDYLVQKVCKKCAGLPLLIRAVGKALKFRSHSLWEEALHYLEKGNFDNIAGIDKQAYACIKLSIDRLPENAKLCLFLCSLFPEDADISIRMLITIATGSQLIPARKSSVHAMVDVLKSSSLLLDGTYSGHIKLHDIVRDVASSLAFSDPKYAFSRLRDNIDFGTRKLLRLVVDGDDFQFHKDLVCPDLHSLWLHCNNLQQFSGGFFSMFVNIRFLMLQSVRHFPEHFSLQPLVKLRELFMIDCDIKEKYLSLLPENLHGLCIRDCDLPRLLNLPNLKNLRKLEIERWDDNTTNKVVFVPNTISNLCSLEELRIPSGYCYFGGPRDSSVQDEICGMNLLTSLEIHLSDFKPCKGTTLFSKLLAYNICVSEQEYKDSRFRASFVSTTRLIKVYGYHSKCLEGLMVRAEELSLSFSDVDVSSICNSNREAFADLRNLYIRECNTLEHLVRILQHSRQPLTSFSQLTILEIVDCSAIKYLFSSSVAKCFTQLEALRIGNCAVMEVIILNEGTSDGDIINFPRLKSLFLKNMRIRSFYGKQKDTHAASTSTANNSSIPFVQYQPLFDGMVAFPSLENLWLYELEDTSAIWGNHYYNDVSSSFSKLKRLTVHDCNKLETVISLSMLHRLQNLEDIDVCFCQSVRNAFVSSIARDLSHLKKLLLHDCRKMTELIGAAEIEEITGGIVLPELKDLDLTYLPCLTRFWCCHSEDANTYKVGFPNLVTLKLQHCEAFDLEGVELGTNNFTCQLKHLIYANHIKLPSAWQLRLHNLETLVLRFYPWCHELKLRCFTKLKDLTVEECKSSTLFKVSDFGSLQQLQVLIIEDCPLLKTIVEDVRGGEPASGMHNNTITLFQLEKISLVDLPNLKSFSSTVNYAFDMPKLYSFSVQGCPWVETFTSLRTSTGLVSVCDEWQHKGQVSDLNDYIRQNRRSGSAGELSYSNQEPETVIERVEEEKPLEERVEEEGYAEETARKE